MIEEYWFILVLIAALSHAIWNFLLKQSENKQIFLWSLRLWSVIIFLPISIYFWPHTSIPLKYWLFWGIGSAFIHSFYAMILTKAYEKSEFTLAYPIARGTGPILVVLFGMAVLKEEVEPITLLGAITIVIGIYIIYSGSIKSGIKAFKSMVESPWPLLVGITIASYTIFDKLAVAFIPPIILNVIENIGQVIVLGGSLVNQKKRILEEWKKYWFKMALAGGFAGLAYILVLVVLTKVPVSYVSPVRETSIVIGTVLGFVFLKEPFHIYKMIGSIMIFIGVVLIVL